MRVSREPLGRGKEAGVGDGFTVTSGFDKAERGRLATLTSLSR